ncbi:MAG: PIN domain-containing protein [Gammaproteobacteria bacterium]|nr:PIN domain-containing protein [Gammaproteobacteria bacterium]MDE0366057.1 PIN domain-containing protein [Gammaproteobacteria bacterium]
MALADTGYWLALANRRDRWHDRAVSATRGVEGRLVVTWPVLAETCHLMLARLGVEAELRFLQQVSINVDIHEIHPERLPEIHVLMEKYRNLPMDLADASLVLAANDLGDGRILSTDRRDFGAYRWKERQPFQNLLIEA